MLKKRALKKLRTKPRGFHKVKTFDRRQESVKGGFKKMDGPGAPVSGEMPSSMVAHGGENVILTAKTKRKIRRR